MVRIRGSWSLPVILLAWVLVLRPPGVIAQSGDTDMGEVGARAGVAFGGGSPGMGTHTTVVGSTGVAFSRYGMALFEASYTPLGQHTIQGWPDRATVGQSYLLDFGLDLHIRVPVNDRVAPYGIIGTGLLWNAVRQDTLTADGTPVSNHYNQFNGALHTGGGLRYYIGRRWGVRPEVKVIVSKQVYTSISFGIFYVVPTDWP